MTWKKVKLSVQPIGVFGGYTAELVEDSLIDIMHLKMSKWKRFKNWIRRIP